VPEFRGKGEVYPLPQIGNNELYVRLYARGEERVDSYEKALLVELY